MGRGEKCVDGRGSRERRRAWACAAGGTLTRPRGRARGAHLRDETQREHAAAWGREAFGGRTRGGRVGHAARRGELYCGPSPSSQQRPRGCARQREPRARRTQVAYRLGGGLADAAAIEAAARRSAAHRRCAARALLPTASGAPGARGRAARGRGRGRTWLYPQMRPQGQGGCRAGWVRGGGRSGRVQTLWRRWRAAGAPRCNVCESF